jgi:hypothetical protein
MADTEKNEAADFHEEENQGGDHARGFLLSRVIRGERRVFRGRDGADLLDRTDDDGRGWA